MSLESVGAPGRESREWETASLVPTLYYPREQFDGIVFFMTDHRSLLSVLVTRAAMRKAAGEAFSDEECLDRFEALRSAFELLACEKFVCGRAEADGSIRIKASDIDAALNLSGA